MRAVIGYAYSNTSGSLARRCPRAHHVTVNHIQKSAEHKAHLNFDHFHIPDLHPPSPSGQVKPSLHTTEPSLAPLSPPQSGSPPCEKKQILRERTKANDLAQEMEKEKIVRQGGPRKEGRRASRTLGTREEARGGGFISGYVSNTYIAHPGRTKNKRTKRMSWKDEVKKRITNELVWCGF